MSAVAMEISLLPLVRCYSRSTVGVNRGQLWFQDVGSFGVLFRLHTWFSISSNQLQKVFICIWKKASFWSGSATGASSISLGSTPSLYQVAAGSLCTSQSLEKLLGTRPGL
ncbi:predicted protein [Lichtheimia corymbifera JMRC:FSU:9682]|uniref:Uncharacterized protein n=1 Tax=Lichtheimia corymbifera JMRC:FSU:9682 TaxID=1263082 RepID=A0A068RZH2_9FUNG|nr:predicted protein [Lichtheimia corymbifera JMRC:FSU:9682]